MPSNHLILCRPISSCLQCFPASESFPMSKFFSSGGQRLEFQLQHQSFQWIFRIDLLYDALVGSPCSPRHSQESSTPQFKSINSSAFSVLYSPTFTSIHDYWKTIALTRWTFLGKVMSLLFNMLARLVITFFPRSKRLLISWLQPPSAVILKNKVWHCFHCFPIYFPGSDGTRCRDLRFLNVEL